jgi:hypothetical protein
LKDIEVDGRVIIKLIFKKQDRVYVAQDSEKWWAFAKTVMNLRVP